MALHHCGTYSTDVYCSCFNQKGVYKDHFKQFNSVNQTYFCCDQLNFSLVSLSEYNSTPSTKITDGVYDFFNTINKRGLTGCSFLDYFVVDNGPSSTRNFINNYPDLYNDYLTIVPLYNKFIAEQELPDTSSPGFVKCSSGKVPYILEYKTPSQVYYNTAYVCSHVNNDIFEIMETTYGRIDYKMKRFWNFSENKPCVGNICQLKNDDYGNIENQGNQQAVYNNPDPPQKDGILASLIIASIIFFFWIAYLIDKHYFNFIFSRSKVKLSKT